MRCFSCLKNLSKDELFFWKGQKYCTTCLDGLAGSDAKKEIIEKPLNKVNAGTIIYGYFAAFVFIVSLFLFPKIIFQLGFLAIVIFNIYFYYHKRRKNK